MMILVFSLIKVNFDISIGQKPGWKRNFWSKMHILGQTPIKRPCPRPAASIHSPNRGMIFSAVLPGNLLGAPVKRRQEIRRILKVKRRLFDIDESPKKKLKIKDEEINFENEVNFVILIFENFRTKD